MKILLGIKRTSSLAGTNEFSPSVSGQQTDVIMSGTEVQVREYIESQLNNAGRVQQILTALDDLEFDSRRMTDEEWEKTHMGLTFTLNEARKAKSYDKVILIDGEVINF